MKQILADLDRRRSRHHFCFGWNPGFHLAGDQRLQSRLRANALQLPAAIDELLRRNGPLVNNRRVTRCAVEVGGQQLEAGERVSVNWISAYRDGILVLQAGSWPAPFGITLVGDRLSSTMVMLAGLTVFAVSVYSLATIDDRRLHPAARRCREG